MATTVEPATAGYSKTSRRQYQACDQCRKSRRACDAGTLRVANFPFREDDHSHCSSLASEACSNCARTSKRCTFDWLSRLPLQGLPKGVKRKLESTVLPGLLANPPPDSTFQSTYYDSYPSAEQLVLPQLAPATNSFHSTHEPIDSGLPNYHILPTYTNNEQTIDGRSVSPEVLFPRDANSDQHVPSILSVSNGTTLAAATQSTANTIYPPPPFSEESTVHDQWATPGLSYQDTTSPSPVPDSNESSNAASKNDSSPSLSSVDTEPSCDEDVLDRQSSKRLKHAGIPSKYSDPATNDRRSSASSRQFEQTNSTTLSSNGRGQNAAPLSTRQVRFADAAMKTMVATGLLRIYHDSFENSLSCWVTEKNCPYESELQALLPHASPASTAEEAALRLCDNRIFSRVSRLDSAFARLRGRELSLSENRSATKALNAAIMAFASQWSHGSHNAFWRSKEGVSQMKACQTQFRGSFSQPRQSNDPLRPSECERVIQKTLWHEARTAIQGSAEIDSFKVILAYMIFALTQRPIDAKIKPSTEAQTSPTENTPDIRRGSDSFSLDDTLQQCADPAMDAIVNEEWNPFYASDLEALASPPIYLETAVRNLFSWRRKIERYRRLRNSDRGHSSMGPLALKDHQTFNLIFWLGVMCDTTSSAISKRPLVISDEDCAVIRESVGVSEDGWQTEDGQYTTAEEGTVDDTGGLWGGYLLSFKWAGPRKIQPRWPCSVDDAALVLQEAIPVKVLLFRKVAQLQTLAYRRTPPHVLEKCVEDTLEVYRHWNSTYGPFMMDCVAQHNNLPSNVQSWYVILDGHWHYGCLLMADTISQIDREEKSMRPRRDLRASCHVIRQLRQENASAIAKIAQASLSEHLPSVPDNAEFHFACNGSAILTEPWTDILVRAMGSACKIFINWLSSWDNPADVNHKWVRANHEYISLYNQAEVCIHGMILLGRKSDAANYTAEVFWNRLIRETLNRRSSSETVSAES